MITRDIELEGVQYREFVLSGNSATAEEFGEAQKAAMELSGGSGYTIYSGEGTLSLRVPIA